MTALAYALVIWSLSLARSSWKVLCMAGGTAQGKCKIERKNAMLFSPFKTQIYGKLTGSVGLLSCHLLHVDLCSLGDIQFVQLSGRGARSQVLCLKTDGSLENLDQESSSLRCHQQDSILATKLSKLHPHHHVLGERGHLQLTQEQYFMPSSNLELILYSGPYELDFTLTASFGANSTK